MFIYLVAIFAESSFVIICALFETEYSVFWPREKDIFGIFLFVVVG